MQLKFYIDYNYISTKAVESMEAMLADQIGIGLLDGDDMAYCIFDESLKETVIAIARLHVIELHHGEIKVEEYE